MTRRPTLAYLLQNPLPITNYQDTHTPVGYHKWIAWQHREHTWKCSITAQLLALMSSVVKGLSSVNRYVNPVPASVPVRQRPEPPTNSPIWYHMYFACRLRPIPHWHLPSNDMPQRQSLLHGLFKTPHNKGDEAPQYLWKPHMLVI